MKYKKVKTNTLTPFSKASVRYIKMADQCNS